MWIKLLTNYSMRFFSASSSVVPKQIQMLIQELDGKVKTHISKVDKYWWISEAFIRGSLRDGHLPLVEAQFLNVLCLQCNFVSNVDLLALCLKPQIGGIGFFVLTILHNDAHWSKPGDLLSAWVRYKHGIHVEQFVADEVEDKSMFSLHRVAEEFATWKNYAEVGVISHSHWKVGTIILLLSVSPQIRKYSWRLESCTILIHHHCAGTKLTVATFGLIEGLLGLVFYLVQCKEIEIYSWCLCILTTWAHESISHVWRNTGAGEVILSGELFTHGVLITWHTSPPCTVLCVRSVELGSDLTLRGWVCTLSLKLTYEI